MCCCYLLGLAVWSEAWKHVVFIPKMWSCTFEIPSRSTGVITFFGTHFLTLVIMAYSYTSIFVTFYKSRRQVQAAALEKQTEQTESKTAESTFTQSASSGSRGKSENLDSKEKTTQKTKNHPANRSTRAELMKAKRARRREIRLALQFLVIYLFYLLFWGTVFVITGVADPERHFSANAYAGLFFLVVSNSSVRLRWGGCDRAIAPG